MEKMKTLSQNAVSRFFSGGTFQPSTIARRAQCLSYSWRNSNGGGRLSYRSAWCGGAVLLRSPAQGLNVGYDLGGAVLLRSPAQGLNVGGDLGGAVLLRSPARGLNVRCDLGDGVLLCSPARGLNVRCDLGDGVWLRAPPV